MKARLPSMLQSRLHPLLLAFALLLEGCISPQSEVELYYPRRGEQKQITLPVLAPSSGQRPSLHVIGFEDVRPWSRVGESRSDWGFHTNVIEPSNSVNQWLRDGLTLALAQEGYGLVARETAGVTIEGKLRELFSAERFSYEALLRLLVVARCGCHGKILISKELTFTTLLDGQAQSGHAESLAIVLEQAAIQIAQELKFLRTSSVHRRAPLSAQD